MKRKGVGHAAAKVLRAFAALRKHSLLEVFRAYRKAGRGVQLLMLAEMRRQLDAERTRLAGDREHWNECVLAPNHAGNCSMRDLDAEAAERLGAPGVGRLAAIMEQAPEAS